MSTSKSTSKSTRKSKSTSKSSSKSTNISACYDTKTGTSSYLIAKICSTALIDRAGQKNEIYQKPSRFRSHPSEGCKQLRDLKLGESHFFGISNISLSRAYHALTFFVFCCVIGTDHPKGGRIAITSTYT